MLIQVLVYNLITLISIAGIGFFPALQIEKKIGKKPALVLIFLALVCGYFLFETAVAIFFTKGITVQWLNLFPFIIIWFLSDSAEIQKAETNWKFGLIPLSLFLFTCWYFVKSYSNDLQNIDRYPFIDLVSYATTTFGMKISGSETILPDAAIYFPDLSHFSLYHFTELWFTVALTKIFGITELYAISFLVPIFLISIIGFGLCAVGSKFKIPVYALFFLVLGLCFANGKLIMYDDIFFYNILDLCGLKLSLIVPVFLFLYLLKEKIQVLIAFAIWLPQVNILLVFLLAISVGLYFLVHFKNFKTLFSKPNLLGYAGFGLFMVVMVLANGTGSSGPPLGNISGFKIIISSFNYCREAVFNLGVNYWLPFVVVSALVISGKNILLLLPFSIAKTGSKLLTIFFHTDPEWNAIPEVILFTVSLFTLNHFFRIFNPQFRFVYLVLFLLCCLGGFGLALTGFMDFEQIYTLAACSLFFITTFFLFKTDESNAGLLKYLGLEKYKWIIGSLVLVAITYRTFRFQRVLPFDQAFYRSISEALAGNNENKYSVYFSTKPFYPFPLHVQAGFPLMFQHNSAISTPISMFEDSSWLNTERVPHVLSLPFPTFVRNDSMLRPASDLIALQKKFIRKYKLRYLWFDQDYATEKMKEFEPAIVQKFNSTQDKLVFWIIDPEKL